MLRGALGGGSLERGAPLVDYATPGGDRVQVWLE